MTLGTGAIGTGAWYTACDGLPGAVGAGGRGVGVWVARGIMVRGSWVFLAFLFKSACSLIFIFTSWILNSSSSLPLSSSLSWSR